MQLILETETASADIKSKMSACDAQELMDEKLGRDEKTMNGLDIDINDKQISIPSNDATLQDVIEKNVSEVTNEAKEGASDKAIMNGISDKNSEDPAQEDELIKDTDKEESTSVKGDILECVTDSEQAANLSKDVQCLFDGSQDVCSERDLETENGLCSTNNESVMKKTVDSETTVLNSTDAISLAELTARKEKEIKAVCDIPETIEFGITHTVHNVKCDNIESKKTECISNQDRIEENLTVSKENEIKAVCDKPAISEFGIAPTIHNDKCDDVKSTKTECISNEDQLENHDVVSKDNIPDITKAKYQLEQTSFDNSTLETNKDVAESATNNISIKSSSKEQLEVTEVMTDKDVNESIEPEKQKKMDAQEKFTDIDNISEVDTEILTDAYCSTNLNDSVKLDITTDSIITIKDSIHDDLRKEKMANSEELHQEHATAESQTETVVDTVDEMTSVTIVNASDSEHDEYHGITSLNDSTKEELNIKLNITTSSSAKNSDQKMDIDDSKTEQDPCAEIEKSIFVDDGKNTFAVDSTKNIEKNMDSKETDSNDSIAADSSIKKNMDSNEKNGNDGDLIQLESSKFLKDHEETVASAESQPLLEIISSNPNNTDIIKMEIDDSKNTSIDNDDTILSLDNGNSADEQTNLNSAELNKNVIENEVTMEIDDTNKIVEAHKNVINDDKMEIDDSEKVAKAHNDEINEEISLLDSKTSEEVTISDEIKENIVEPISAAEGESTISSEKLIIEKSTICDIIPVLESKSESDLIEIPQDDPVEVDTCIVNEENVSNSQTKSDVMNVVKATQLSHDRPGLSGLSNTLDILSDDDDEPPSNLSKDDNNKESLDSKSIHIDDDDDVMVIEETVNKEVEIIKDDKNEKEKVCEKEFEVKSGSDVDSVPENKIEQEVLHENITDKADEKSLDVNKQADSIEEVAPVEKLEINEKQEVSKLTPVEDEKPLVPANFLKSFKTSVADMTRSDLEEFCLLKIVEAVIDRTSLSDIKTKLKTMSQNVDEWRKKAMMLTKQNRDLQIVLKTVQEEQKKRTDAPIIPLKITRSVGMQVFMSESVVERGTNRRKTVAVPQQSISTPLKTTKPGPGRPPKNNNVPIPVPRLVPASVNSPVKQSPAKVVKTAQQVQGTPPANNASKSTTPNGWKTAAQQTKAEKRPLSSTTSSVTVDLTDDEPPPKQLAAGPKNAQAPVRLVPSQQLMAARPQMQGARKVYIPINQNQAIRPGQTIMVKQVPANAIRQRAPGSNLVRMQNANQVRMPRNMNLRHPGPLPDAPRQQQAPNWKALPPSPTLKISKVENGIVISWTIDDYEEDAYEKIASYQLYAYQETSAPPSTLQWKKIGDVKALALPMACTLTQFMSGFKYYFAVRAIDIRSRIGAFSLPGSILLLNK